MKTKNFKVKWSQDKYLPDISVGIQTRVERIKGVKGVYNIWKERTTCSIYNQDDRLIAQSEARRYYKDQPNRRLGNKIAFKKAVDQISDKILRTEFWEAYKQLSVKCINC